MRSLEPDLIISDVEPQRDNFYPLSLTRPSFDFLFGTRTILQKIEKALHQKASILLVPKFLEETSKEVHQEVSINSTSSRTSFLVNSMISVNFDLKKYTSEALSEKEDVALVDEESGIPVFAVLEDHDGASLSSIVSKRKSRIKKKLVSNGLIRYPWQLFQRNSQEIESDFRKEEHAAGSESRINSELLGKKFSIGENVSSSRYVTLDSRGGPIVIEDGVILESFTLIQGPAFIGRNSVIKSAKIREGTSIGQFCKASGEIEETIMFDYSNKSHEGFIGHSLIGSWVNLGALTTNSDLKNTYGEISMNIQNKSMKTGSNKVGIVVGDMSKTSIGAFISSGKVIGVSSHVFGTVLDNVPSFTFYAKSLGAQSREMYLDSAIETQRRVMKRRDRIMTRAEEKLLESIFKATEKSRREVHVRPGRFDLSK